jgi:hypothetical protein
LLSSSYLLFNLKMEAIFSSETSVDFYRTTRRYVAKGRDPHNHRYKNLKSCISWRRLFSVFFLSPFRQILRQFLDSGKDSFLRHPSQFIIHYHPIIRQHTFVDSDSFFK